MLLTVFTLSFVVVWCSIWPLFTFLGVLLVPPLRGGRFGGFVARRIWARPMLWAASQKVVLLDSDKCPSTPAIYLSNHQGTPDIALIYQLPVNLRFVAKAALQHVPFLGWYMRADGHVFIDRDKRRDAIRSLERAGERIRNGASVVMFPEGTRSRDGKILPFKKGPFRLAIAAQVPIVPLAVEGPRNCWPKGSYWITAGTCTLKVGTPIPTEGLGPQDCEALMVKVRRAIIDLHLQIGGAGGDLENNIAAQGQHRPQDPIVERKSA